ncbi:MAG: alpha/beta hydrolase [Woeseia sp.]
MKDDLYKPRVTKREQRLTIRGMDCRVHEWGDPLAPPLLYLHGWGDCAATFQFVVDHLRGERRVIAPDWRGFGDSAHNPEAYWFPDYLADVDAVLSALQLPPSIPVVGHSMGANVAALFAGVFPERVSALINIEGFGLPDSDPDDAPKNYRRWIETARSRREHPGFATPGKLIERIRERSPTIDDERARFVAACWTRQDAHGRLHLKADMAHRWPNAVLYRRAEVIACWQRIKAPTLLVCGAESDFRDGVKVWQDPARCPFPNARCVTVPAAGHMLQFEQPGLLATHLEDFLDEHEV